MKKTKILIADDHIIVREGIRALLSARDGIVVVGEASNGREALEKVEKLSPDIVLMDLSMPLLNGVEATRHIRARFPECKVLVLTMHENREYMRQIFRAGASGYIVKKSAATQLFSAIEAIQRGKAFFSPSVSKMLLDDFIKIAGNGEEILSAREKEILQLVAEGHPNKVIAGMLFISVKTVEGHKENIKKKLGVHNQAGLIKYAIKKGLIHLNNLD